MVEFFPFIVALGAGIGFGIFYFGGLWLTVRKLPRMRRPMLLILVSFFGRMAVILVGFYFVMGGDWRRLFVCLVGFLGTRFILSRRLRPEQPDVGQQAGRQKAEAQSFHPS